MNEEMEDLQKEFEELKAALKAAGYTDRQIEKEAAYMAAVARQDEIARSSPEWNYGFYRADFD